MGNLTKRNILWVVPMLLIVAYCLMLGMKDKDSVKFIQYIKESRFNDSNKNLEVAFNEYCADGQWEFFKTSYRQNVVEFSGTCPVQNDQEANIQLQFIVEKDRSDFIVGAMLLEGELISEHERDEFLSKIGSSNNEIATP